MTNNVDSPKHYIFGSSQVIDITQHLDFLSGNVVKYVCRAGRKDPDKTIEDLEKASYYLSRLIAKRKKEIT